MTEQPWEGRWWAQFGLEARAQWAQSCWSLLTEAQRRGLGAIWEGAWPHPRVVSVLGRKGLIHGRRLTEAGEAVLEVVRRHEDLTLPEAARRVLAIRDRQARGEGVPHEDVERAFAALRGALEAFRG